MKALLLAGTAEARALSFALAERGVDCVASLAGLTNRPAEMGGTLRVGGFGGVGGLASYLRDNDFTHIVDATHPFAAIMSANAAKAAAETGLRLLRLDRPPWPVQPNWTIVPDMDAAATILPTGARVFLATGRGSVAAFAGRCDVSFVLRVIEADPGPSPWPHIEYMVARPPFSVEEERATLHRLGIGLLVARNSGGTGGTEKLQAASALKLPVIMVARPKAGQGRIVQTSEDVLDWLGV